MINRTVLFVDDEVNILNSLRRGLIDEEYESIFANSGQEALKLLEENEVHVLVTDMKMPEMDGLTLLKIVREKYPSIICIVLSGYTQLQQILATINQVDIFKFITKPWKLEEEFKHIINQALDYYNLQAEREELKKALENKNIAYQQMLKNMGQANENLKKESAILRDTYHLAFDYLDDLLKDQNETIREALSFVKGSVTNYEEIASSSATDFDLKVSLEESLNRLKDNPQISTWEYSSNIPEPSLARGHFEILIFLITSFLESFFNQEDKFYVKINADLKEKPDNNLLLEVTILLVNLGDNFDFQKGKIVDDKLSFLKPLFQQSLKNSLGNFVINRIENKLALKIIFNFQHD